MYEYLDVNETFEINMRASGKFIPVERFLLLGPLRRLIISTLASSKIANVAGLVNKLPSVNTAQPSYAMFAPPQLPAHQVRLNATNIGWSQYLGILQAQNVGSS
ncbi:hypothetical protein EVAR_62121_1 [Eumeta japonica]|uniref:Uncharacterized protein n=1 Tax=Eumeta variegata TaxID=151549 RepID=A0A4C1ZC24_EUMVA|nr:hypothetical protein EVAR_62121_1 [Eumeta japonica]